MQENITSLEPSHEQSTDASIPEISAAWELEEDIFYITDPEEVIDDGSEDDDDVVNSVSECFRRSDVHRQMNSLDSIQ